MLGDMIIVCKGTPTAIDIIAESKVPTYPEVNRPPPLSSCIMTELLIVKTNLCRLKKISVTTKEKTKQMIQGEVQRVLLFHRLLYALGRGGLVCSIHFALCCDQFAGLIAAQLLLGFTGFNMAVVLVNHQVTGAHLPCQHVRVSAVVGNF